VTAQQFCPADTALDDAESLLTLDGRRTDRHAGPDGDALEVAKVAESESQRKSRLQSCATLRTTILVQYWMPIQYPGAPNGRRPGMDRRR